MRIAVLVKQVPALEELRLGADGRLRRAGSMLELNPYCRRAVAKGVELARATGGACTVLTLGPPEAADALREALAWGADHGILVTDLAFAGSDTLATARALAAALRREGSFDLILTGRNSVDADTGQVAPQLAALLDLPHLGPVRELELAGGTVQARCERDDGYVCATVRLPAVLSAAERLCAPAKVPPAERALVPDDRIRTVTAADLGPGPWGAAGSPTAVGRTRLLTVERSRRRGSGPLADQVRAAARAVAAVTPGLAGVTPGLAGVTPGVAGVTPGLAGVTPGVAGVTPGVAGVTPGLAGVSRRRVAPQPRSHGTGAPQPRSHGTVAVLAEPGRDRATRELLGAAQRLASRAVLLTAGPVAPRTAWSWHADELVQLPDAGTAEDAAEAVLAWCAGAPPWALLASSTCWGREVAARVAARLGAGLTGDAVELETVAGRLVCWKPAFGGQLVAAVTASSPIQLATVRPGALPLPEPRTGAAAIRVSAVEVSPRGRVRVTEVVRDDDPDALALARVVVGVGRGIAPAEYPDLKPLLELLDAELGATRKVTDLGWLPRSRQIGITGQSIAPDLYIALAVHGKLTHLAGVRGARFVLAVNADPSAPVFDAADFGIVGDWRDVVPLLVRELGGYVPGIVAKTV